MSITEGTSLSVLLFSLMALARKSEKHPGAQRTFPITCSVAFKWHQNWTLPQDPYLEHHVPSEVFKDLHENLQIVLWPLWLHLSANPTCLRVLLHHLQNQTNFGYILESLPQPVFELQCNWTQHPRQGLGWKYCLATGPSYKGWIKGGKDYITAVVKSHLVGKRGCPRK